jgi:hypothetical protein
MMVMPVESASVGFFLGSSLAGCGVGENRLRVLATGRWEKVGDDQAESLILAQNERWRRA